MPEISKGSPRDRLAQMSIRFADLARTEESNRGEHIVSDFLDNILPACCSDEIVNAFLAARDKEPVEATIRKMMAWHLAEARRIQDILRVMEDKVVGSEP